MVYTQKKYQANQIGVTGLLFADRRARFQKLPPGAKPENLHQSTKIKVEISTVPHRATILREPTPPQKPRFFFLLCIQPLTALTKRGLGVFTDVCAVNPPLQFYWLIQYMKISPLFIWRRWIFFGRVGGCPLDPGCHDRPSCFFLSVRKLLESVLCPHPPVPSVVPPPTTTAIFVPKPRRSLVGSAVNNICGEFVGTFFQGLLDHGSAFWFPTWPRYRLGSAHRSPILTPISIIRWGMVEPEGKGQEFDLISRVEGKQGVQVVVIVLGHHGSYV